MQAVQFGNPAERNDIAMGPLINAAALERVEQKVARAVEEGARVALGGKAVEGKGYYYPPTLLLDVRQEMSIMHEETFGPVLRWSHLTRWKRLSQWLMTVITA